MKTCGKSSKSTISSSRTRPYYSRRCKGLSSTNIDCLPEDLLSLILQRLEAAYLYDNVSRVSRRWYRLLNTSAFAKSHIEDSPFGLLLTDKYEGGHPIFLTATEGGIEKYEYTNKCSTHLCGSFNSLAMEIYRASGDLYVIHIMNPTTKQSFVLPSFPFHSSRQLYCGTFGVSYAAHSLEYKVALSYIAHKDDSSYWALAILTVGVDKSWRYVPVEHLSKASRSLLCSSPLITEGFMHWGEKHRADYLTLDVESETLTLSEVPLPQEDYSNARKYFMSTGTSLTLSVTHENLLWEIWVMKTGSTGWMKLPDDISLGGVESRLQQICGGDVELLVPLGWIKYPNVMAFCFRSRSLSPICILYNLSTHEMDTIELSTCCAAFHAIVHKSTLTWLP